MSNTKKSNRFFYALISIVIVALIVGAIIFVICIIVNPDILTPPAQISDITGNWTEDLLNNTFTFIPSCNIKGLVLQFRIYDSDHKLQNTIDKAIGDVKKGQQYSVTLSLNEYWTGSQVETILLQGIKTLF